ncbi:aldehyde dehydrogenase domain-containing protein [Dipodascopsis uninucleata]
MFTTLKFPIINEEYEQPTGLFINNEFVKAKSGKTFKVITPIDCSHLCDLQEANHEDVDVAVEAASKAFKTWKKLTAGERGEYIRKLADLIDRDSELFAKIESLNNGKSLLCARFDVGLVVKYLRFCAASAESFDGRLINTGSDHMTYTKREPLGVCGQIIPWNFPFMMWSWKIGPAIATGNTVVLKPASATPLSALYAAKLVKEAGIPPGVVNIIPGSGSKCGNAIITHPKIRKVAFTGSTEIGRGVMVGAAENIKKVTLELGGKSPNIVFDDCDIDNTIENIIRGIFFNGGEVCSAGSRLYVQAGIYDTLVAKLKETVEKIKVGNPFDEGVFQGAQTTPDQFQTVMDYIKLGKDEGAKVLTGGERIGEKGYFLRPTILLTENENYRVIKEEIFGPVATLSKFSTIEEVVNMANDSNFGLAAGVHTNDLSKAIDVSNQLEAGTVWINTYNDFHHLVPFGGYKESGVGREMGLEGFDNYTQVKAVNAKLLLKSK